MSGKFITFEGCEGVGKSTQLRLLKDYLEKTSQPAIFTREPGGTEVAEAVRSLLLSSVYKISPMVEAYLFATARADHIARVIKPALERGEIVVCDRYLDSSIAYQGYARGLGYDKVLEVNAAAVNRCLPDCTVFIDMDPAMSWRKQNGKHIINDRIENESKEFHSKVYEGYKSIAADNPRFVSVVPSADKLETHRNIIKLLKEKGMIS
ncbi:MAG: dTMP kinase [Clostridia bacterium]|nr:dTMP kinase [Clostridia bacterium]